jgi:hypothetical protein
MHCRFQLQCGLTGCFLPACCAPHLHPACFTRNRKLNDLLGRIAITLYAYFDYNMLHKKVSCRGLLGCNSLYGVLLILCSLSWLAGSIYRQCTRGTRGAGAGQCII